MKYCINYYKDFRYLNEIDEIIFTPKDINENFIKYVEDNFKRKLNGQMLDDEIKFLVDDIVQHMKSLHSEHTNPI